MIVLHPIHQTIIIITECHAIASTYDFLTLDGVSLHPSFRFDIAAIHGRNGELHVSVGVGRVLATLELVVWYDDAIMYVLCDRGRSFAWERPNVLRIISRWFDGRDPCAGNTSTRQREHQTPNR